MNKYEVIIVGGGPSGLTAGLYTARAGLKTLLIERSMYGGQIVNANSVENYPGFPDGISGFDLATLIHQQATKYGVEIVISEVTTINKAGDNQFTVITPKDTYEAEAVIITSGSEYRKLDVEGEEKLVGRGVSYCATCDGFLFRGREVAVIGGGDTAITDAIELCQHASKVYLIHRRDQLRAGQVLQQRAFSQPNLEFIWDTVVDEVIGSDKVDGLLLRNVKTGTQSTLNLDGVFVAVGVLPNSQNFANLVSVDEAGNIIADNRMATSVEGIFTAGDIRSNSSRQVSTAVGDGATAGISAYKFLREG